MGMDSNAITDFSVEPIRRVRHQNSHKLHHENVYTMNELLDTDPLADFDNQLMSARITQSADQAREHLLSEEIKDEHSDINEAI